MALELFYTFSYKNIKIIICGIYVDNQKNEKSQS